MDTNIETIEPSGSNDALFCRTMADLDARIQQRSHADRRRMITGVLLSLVLFIALVSMLETFL